MVYFPLRKCYHAAKVTLLFILVVAVLALFEQWRGGKRGTSAFSDPEEAEFERQILEDEARIIPGLGEGGVAAYLMGEDKKRGEESEKKLAMNVYLSDRIAYNRTLKDHRNPACDRVIYDAELPSASVILIFHNEPYSVVLRTIWSVINSCRRENPWYRRANYIDNKGRTMKLGYPGQDPTSPLVYLKEIILVDDNSTLPELKGKLSHYVRTRLPPDLIRILRLPDRQGLMQARMVGARAARGDVLVFLDAHCEGEADWLRPLLQRVRHKRDAVLTPIIDVIDQTDFTLEAAQTYQVGGFTFTGHFTWIDVPEREKKRRGSDISPTWSPTMAGGLFAINRAYYWELGAYDEQMAGWGGENLEMSFRIWQCGGTLETIPCSRVGHVFRSFHPYGLPSHTDTHGINTARMAEVWMDEYAELFYLHRPDLRNNPKIGDVTHRKILREKLQCKSFQWYLDNIYKEKFVPVRDAYGYGRFQNLGTGLCLDTLQRESEAAPLGVYQCHPTLQASQYFVLSLNNELRGEDECAYAQHKSRNSQESEDGVRKILRSTCHGKQREQKWQYKASTKQILHTESGLCVDAGTVPGGDALLRPCSDVSTQKWLIDYSEDNDFVMPNEVDSTDQQLKLRRLRGQKRKSRSLLSYSNPNSIPNSTVRRHTHKKHKKRSRKSKKTKNKFILKLVRTLMNNSQEHLEVDIHCKHRQLYPNNTFVRDLVTILNDKNIKVINNGRVFERNKVTQLDEVEEGGGGGGGAGEEPRVLNKLDIPPPDAMEQKITKKARKMKPRPVLQPLPEPLPPPSATSAPPVSTPGAPRGEGPGGATEPRAHRIIIEDFVELTPANTPRPRRMKKRKRKRPSVPTASPLRTETEVIADEDRNELVAMLSQNHPTNNIEEQLRVPPATHSGEQDGGGGGEAGGGARVKDSSGEEGAAGGGAGRGGSVASAERDYWPLGESRFRRNNTGWRRHDTDSERPVHHHRDEMQSQNSIQQRADDEVSPVKVVMRSNLTFNLGDEFFRWARDKDSSPADLSIPSSPREAPASTWSRGDVTSDFTDTEPKGRARPDSDSEDNSNTSNTSNSSSGDN